MNTTKTTPFKIYTLVLAVVLAVPLPIDAQVVAWGNNNPAPPAFATDRAFGAASFDDHLFLFAKNIYSISIAF